jgi:hydroxyacylglutathione hydrolase
VRNVFFTCDLVNDYTYRIKGLGGELCYLVLGKKKALLIDGLCGVGSLKSYIETLTKLPVTLVLTHAHRDHDGAAWEYGECWLHPDDIPLLYTSKHSSAKSRFDFASQSEPVKRGLVTLKDTVPQQLIKTYPVYDGDIFDLEGVQIEAISVPGHSYGSLVFLDRKARMVYSGDACNIMTLIGFTGCTTIEEYRNSLMHFKTYQDDFDVCYGGHGFYPVPNTIIGEALELCEKIMNGTDQHLEMHGLFGVPVTWLAAERGEMHKTKYGGNANILYDRKNIRKRSHPLIQGRPNLYK